MKCVPKIGVKETPKPIAKPKAMLCVESATRSNLCFMYRTERFIPIDGQNDSLTVWIFVKGLRLLNIVYTLLPFLSTVVTVSGISNGEKKKLIYFIVSLLLGENYEFA